jgi:GNAT superfamily N-acetyltransferase
MEILLHDPMNDSRSDAAALWASLHAFRCARAAESSPGDPVISDAEFEAMSREQSPNYVSRRWLAVDSGRVVGSLDVNLTRPGSPEQAANSRFATADLGVIGSWRRRGVATRLIAQLHRVMCEEGREIVTIATHEPDGHAVLQHMGARDRLRMIESWLQINEAAWTSLERMKMAIIAANPELKLEAYRGRVPLDVLEPLLPELRLLFDDKPSGELERRGSQISMRNIEESYRWMERSGSAHHFVLLRTPGGGFAGCTEATWNARSPHRCWHNFTGVHRDWRGRKLAHALKISMLQQIREAQPEVVETGTHVAAMNASMLAVNTSLGFRPYRTHGTYQLERDRLGAWLAERVEM